MKTLFELAKYNANSLDIIKLLMPSGSEKPINKLLSIVFDDKFINDTQAMVAIYGRKNLATFFSLKTQLKEILIKATLMMNSKWEAKHSRINESINLYRHAIVSKTLYQDKKNQLAVEIAEKSIIKSIKYSSTENIVELARMLVRHYGSAEYNKGKLNKYLAIQEKYINVYLCEIKAENYFNDLQRDQLKSTATPTDLIKNKAKSYVDELNKITDVHSYLFYVNRYKVQAAYLEYQKDFEGLLDLSDRIFKDLSIPAFKTNNILGSIILRKTWALIQAGRNKEAIKLVATWMKKLPSGSLQWYFHAHYKLKAQLYNGEYKEAVVLIKSMIEDPQFLKIGENYKELFLTTLGYIHLIANSGIAGDPKKLQKILPEFKIGKFLNTIPVFSKDKRGINVSILLMHVAMLLQRKHFDKIIDRIDSLNQYAYKYLRKDDTFRSNCMIKMVVQMTKANFHPIRTERYTRDLLKQLEHVKLAGSGENIETEIIPYEVLWSIMLKALK